MYENIVQKDMNMFQIHISFVSLVPFQSETHEPKVWHVKFLDEAFQRWPCYQHKLVEHPCSAHQGPAKVDCILTYEQLILWTHYWHCHWVMALKVECKEALGKVIQNEIPNTYWFFDIKKQLNCHILAILSWVIPA